MKDLTISRRTGQERWPKWANLSVDFVKLPVRRGDGPLVHVAGKASSTTITVYANPQLGLIRRACNTRADSRTVANFFPPVRRGIERLENRPDGVACRALSMDRGSAHCLPSCTIRRRSGPRLGGIKASLNRAAAASMHGGIAIRPVDCTAEAQVH